MQATLEFLERHLHAPAPSIQAQNGTRLSLLESGHKESHLIRPCVTPFFRHYHGDITQMVKRRPFLKHPVITPATIRLADGAATIRTLGQVAHQIADILAVSKFSVSSHGKHIRPTLLVNEFQRRVGCKSRLSQHHDLTHPRREVDRLKHLPKQDILMTFDLGGHHRQANRNAKGLPTGNQQHHFKTKVIR